MSTTLKGQCLCGQTTITIENAESYAVQVLCHCWDCKQTSGSAFSTNILAIQKDTKIEGPVKTYDTKGASGNTVTRVFCGSCGSAISHRSVVFGEAAAIQTGNFREFATRPIVAELFSKDRWTALSPIEGAGQQ